MTISTYTTRLIVLGAVVLLNTAVGIRPALGQCQEDKLVPFDQAPGITMGNSIAVRGDTAVFGATGAWDGKIGAAYILRFDGIRWIAEGKLMASDGHKDDLFGGAVAVWDDTVLIGADRNEERAYGAGAAYVFRFDGTRWVEEQKLTASDGDRSHRFGRAVAIEGATAIVGTHRGVAYIFHFDGAKWVEEQQLWGSEVGFSSALALRGRQLLVGAQRDDSRGHNAGAAHVFGFDGSHWVEEQKLLASDGVAEDYFGLSVAILRQAAVIGAWNRDERRGKAYVFRFGGESWAEEAKLHVDAPYFGFDVDVEGDNVIVGSVYDQGRPGEESKSAGAAYVFSFDGQEWVEGARVYSSDGLNGDGFGIAVALWGDIALVGARAHGGNAEGAVYTFDVQGCLCRGNEKLKKPKCKGKKGRNKLTTRVIRGKAGDMFTIELSSGDNAQGFLNDKGKGKATFSDLPTGPGEATATWECGFGRQQRRSYECP